MIPRVLTRYLQSFDVSINKSFQALMKNIYINSYIEKEEGYSKVFKENIINLVGEVKYSNKISLKLINKSFKIARITLNTDRSEDKMFIGYNRLFTDYQEMVERVEQSSILDNQVKKIKHD